MDLLANINVYAAVQPGQLLDTLKQLNEHPELLVRLVQALKNHGQYDQQLDAFLPLLLARSQSPDFIQDHGHTFGSELAGRSEAGVDRVHEDVLAEVGLRLWIKTLSFSR